jgi:hypothetical protein
MVNNQNTDSFSPQSQQPVLHRQPGITGSLAARGHKRREVVQNEKVHAIEMRLKSLLPFSAAEIDTNLAVVGGCAACHSARRYHNFYVQP